MSHTPKSKNIRAGKVHLDVILGGGIILGWLLLQTVVFPSLGVST